MVEEFELAVSRARGVLDRVSAAWDDEHPDDPVHRARPTAPAWYPDPTQAR